MKKSKIITIITAVLAVVILVIIGVLIFGNQADNNQEIINVNKDSSNVQPDVFKATVISVDATKLTVVASEDAAIAQANNARMVDVIYNNVTIMQAGQTVDISAVQPGQEITISYDGNIIIASPITIKADKIEF